MEKKIMVSIAIIALLIILGGIWFLPSAEKSVETTGAAVTDQESQTEKETNLNENSEIADLTKEELLDKCLNTCGADASNAFEASIWSKMCNEKYKYGEEALIKFVKTC